LSAARESDPSLPEEQPTMAARPRASRASLPAPGAAPFPAPEPEKSSPLGEAPTSEPAAASEPRTGESAPTSTRTHLTGSPSTASLVRSSRDFLRQDEASRTHNFATAMLVVVVLGVACLLFLPADPLATKLAAGAMVVLGLGFLTLFVHTRDVERFDPAFVGWLAAVLAIGSVPMVYYFGVFSPFPCAVALALFVHALSSPARYALLSAGLCSGGHVAVALAVYTGAIDDRGLMRPGEDLPGSVWIFGQGAVQLVYWTAYFVGHSSFRRTHRTVKDLEAAVRQVAAREALLREARQELERAAGIGEPGRFTEQRLGPWILGPLLGRGGMGEIYEASHVDSGDPAALKLLLRGAYAESDPFTRFAREARIAESLDSQHVVGILDIGGPESPLPYIAMERLRGEDLAAMLRTRRRLRPEEVAKLIAEVAHALDEAAGARIVHRDLKPSNVFFTTEGSWKVLDFGVSKLIGEAGTLTAGHVVGTPAYMAPEQARGEDVDARADLYSLGVIAYRALTGRPAFVGKDFARMLRAVESTLPPAPSRLVEGLPAAVDDVLRIAMAKAPADRFDTASSFAEALRAAFAGTLRPDHQAHADALNATLPWSR